MEMFAKTQCFSSVCTPVATSLLLPVMEKWRGCSSSSPAKVYGIHRLRQWISQLAEHRLHCTSEEGKVKMYTTTITQHDPFWNVTTGPGKIVAEMLHLPYWRSNKSYWYHPQGVTLCCLHCSVRQHRATTPLLSYAFQAQSPIDVIEFFIASCRELDPVISSWLELALPQIQISRSVTVERMQGLKRLIPARMFNLSPSHGIVLPASQAILLRCLPPNALAAGLIHLELLLGSPTMHYFQLPSIHDPSIAES